MRAVASWLDTIGQVFQAIPDLATPEQVQSALREILDDPELLVYWWDWELERYVDVRGAAAEELPLLQQVAGVLLCELDQAHLLASLRDVGPHRAARARMEELLQHGAVLELER